MKKYDTKKIMSRAWAIAREAAAKDADGKASEYIREAMRMAWAEAKAEAEKPSFTLKSLTLPALTGTEKQVAYAETIRAAYIDWAESRIDAVALVHSEKRDTPKSCLYLTKKAWCAEHEERDFTSDTFVVRFAYDGLRAKGDTLTFTDIQTELDRCKAELKKKLAKYITLSDSAKAWIDCQKDKLYIMQEREAEKRAQEEAKNPETTLGGEFATLTVAQVQELEKLGATRWTKGSYDRLYLNEAAEKLLKLEVGYYKSGYISWATIDGENISHAHAGRVLSMIKGAYIDLTAGGIVDLGDSEKTADERKALIQAIDEKYRTRK